MSNRNPKSAKEEVSKWREASRRVDVIIYSLVLLYLGEPSYGGYTMVIPMVLARWAFLMPDNEPQFFNSTFKAIGQYVSYGSKWFPWIIVLFSVNVPTNNLVPIIVVIVSEGKAQRFYVLIMLYALLSVIYHSTSIQSIKEQEREHEVAIPTTPIKTDDKAISSKGDCESKGEIISAKGKMTLNEGTINSVTPNSKKDDELQDKRGMAEDGKISSAIKATTATSNTRQDYVENRFSSRLWSTGFNIEKLKCRVIFTINKIDSGSIAWLTKGVSTLKRMLNFKRRETEEKDSGKTGIEKNSSEESGNPVVSGIGDDAYDIDNPVYDNDLIVITQLENDEATLITTLITKEEMVDLDKRFKNENHDTIWNMKRPERVHNLIEFGALKTPKQIRVVFKRKHEVLEPLHEVKAVFTKAEKGNNESLLEVTISPKADYDTTVAATIQMLRNKIPFIRRGLYSVDDGWLGM